MRDHFKIIVLLILLPWIVTAIGLVIVHYGDAIDRFFERVLKTLLL